MIYSGTYNCLLFHNCILFHRVPFLYPTCLIVKIYLSSMLLGCIIIYAVLADPWKMNKNDKK